MTSLPADSYVKTRLYHDTFENSLYSFDDATYTTISKKYAFRSSYDDYTCGGSMELGSRFIAGNTLKAAFHYKNDVHRENNEGYPQQRFEDRIISAGLEDTIDFTSTVYAIIGISYDRVKTLAAEDVDSAARTLKDFPMGDTDAVNPQAGLFYKLSDTDILHASVAKKARLPSIKDKFSYRLGTALPNPELEPEKSVNYEIGYQALLLDGFTVETNLFYCDVSNFILFKTIPDPGNPLKTPNQNQNIGDINQYGLELSISGQILASLTGGANYAYIQYDNKSTTDKLLNIPHNKVFAYLQYRTPLDGVSVLGSIDYNSDRFSSTDGIRVAGEYTLLNAKAIYAIYRGVSVEGGVNNLTDENYGAVTK
jgi:iron complex outermembrane receptor protein